MSVAWGVYARSCDEVDTFVSACIGCDDQHTTGVVLIDAPRASDTAAHYTRWQCGGVRRPRRLHTFFASQLLPATPPSDLPPTHRRYWPRTRALMRQMAALAPHAAYYIKADSDALLNVLALRAAIPPGAADYIGKPMSVFEFQGAPLTYMQGGAFVLSRPAALRLATCKLGSWRHCPPSVFTDISSAAGDRRIHERCDSPQTNAEDLLTGVCVMHLANASVVAVPRPLGHPCFRTLGRGTIQHRQHLRADSVSALSEVGERLRRARGGLCRCPISAHPLPGSLLLQAARNLTIADGCGQADVLRRAATRLEALDTSSALRFMPRTLAKLPDCIAPTPQGLPAGTCLLPGVEFTGGTLRRASMRTRRIVHSGAQCYLACVANPECDRFTFKRVLPAATSAARRAPAAAEPARCFLKTGEKSTRYGHGAFNRPLPCRDGSDCVSARVGRNGTVVRYE